MGQGREAKRVTVHQEAPHGGGTSLGDLLRKAGLVQEIAAKEAGPEVARPGIQTAKKADDADKDSGAIDLSGCGKIVLRRQRKGHGGRTVTRIEGLALATGALDRLAREVAKAMGCGARAEEDAVVVQGEPGERLDTWLSARGIRKVVHGN